MNPQKNRKSLTHLPSIKKKGRQDQSLPPKTSAPAQLPSRGDVQHFTVGEANAGQRLDNFLQSVLKGVPKSFIYRIIRSGEVRVNKGRAKALSKLAEGDEVRVPPVRQAEAKAAPLIPKKSYPILYEDEALLVVNKPEGLAVHGGSGLRYGLIEQMKQQLPQYPALELVHRLDRDTSGAIIIAKKRPALRAMQEQFRQREPEKIYLALVKGVWQEGGKKGLQVIDLPLLRYLTPEGERRVRVVGKDHTEGRRSVTIVRLVKAFHQFSLLSVHIKTGRTHQIRVHLSHLGYPIIGDEKYGDFELNKRMEKQYGFARMFLHASELSFEHPQTHEQIHIQAPLPTECQKIIEELGNE